MHYYNTNASFHKAGATYISFEICNYILGGIIRTIIKWYYKDLLIHFKIFAYKI